MIDTLKRLHAVSQEIVGVMQGISSAAKLATSDREASKKYIGRAVSRLRECADDLEELV